MSDKMLREALEEIVKAAKAHYEAIAVADEKLLRATPPEGGEKCTCLRMPDCPTHGNHSIYNGVTASPSRPAKEERRCKCGHTRLDHYPDSPCAICACEVYRPAPQPAATGQGEETNRVEDEYGQRTMDEEPT
jgi:hypothetical protein